MKNASQTCPTCGESEEIEYVDDHFNRDTGEVVDDAICCKCGTSWQDVYQFSHQTGIEATQFPDGNPVACTEKQREQFIAHRDGKYIGTNPEIIAARKHYGWDR